MVKKIIFLFGLSLMSSILLQAQSLVLPLDSVVARITKTNQGLQAYNEKINAQNAYASGARNLDAPKISAGQYQTPYQVNPALGSFMISAEQMFTNPAKLRAKENYLKGTAAITQLDKQFYKNQLMAQALQNYYDRVILEKKKNVLRTTRILLEYMLKDANIRYTYGKEKLNNIYKAKADLFQLGNDTSQLNNDIRQKTIMLNTLMNQDKQTDFSVDTNIVIKAYENISVDTAVLAVSRSDIKAIDRNIQLQQLNAAVELSKRKPDFGLQASHMISYGGMPNQYILMGSITLPIVPWASREYKANLKGIGYEIEGLRKQKENLVNETEGKLTALKVEILNKKQQLKNYNQNIIPALENNYKTAKLAYAQNTGDLFVVLDGSRALQAARLEALDRLQELLDLQVSYEKENETTAAASLPLKNN
jgi:cobalt-zinc-cadmium efflux system outer membrane protein